MAKINPDEADLCCDSCEVHENLVKIVNETMPDETELYDLAELFKVFGDSTRIQILFVLFEAEVCVCDLAEALHMTQSAISHQLRILKQNKLVKSRREGKSVFYSLADGHVRTIIAQGQEHIEEIKKAHDRQKRSRRLMKFHLRDVSAFHIHSLFGKPCFPNMLF